MTVGNAAQLLRQWFEETAREDIAYPLVEMLNHRLQFLCEVGVEYLTLDRAAQSLSGGEWQRLTLATQIGSALAGVPEGLEQEPSSPATPRDCLGRRRLRCVDPRLGRRSLRVDQPGDLSSRRRRLGLRRGGDLRREVRDQQAGSSPGRWL